MLFTKGGYFQEFRYKTCLLSYFTLLFVCICINIYTELFILKGPFLRWWRTGALGLLWFDTANKTGVRSSKQINVGIDCNTPPRHQRPLLGLWRHNQNLWPFFEMCQNNVFLILYVLQPSHLSDTFSPYMVQDRNTRSSRLHQCHTCRRSNRGLDHTGLKGRDSAQVFNHTGRESSDNIMQEGEEINCSTDPIRSADQPISVWLCTCNVQ